MAKCKFVSCFSYKGGAGRSTLAINVVPFLAEKLKATEDRPFVLVDMDIDSCGLTYLFELHKEEKTAEDCVQQWFYPKGARIPQESDDEDMESATEHEMFQHLFPVGKFFNFEDKAILCLPAKPGLSMGSNDSNYDASRVNKGLDIFKQACDNFACGVLFDSAVGNQLTANWSNRYSNYILCCMRPTKQFLDGTNRFFDTYDEKAQNKKIIVIPNVVPTDELNIDGNQYPDYAKERIIESFKDNRLRGNNTYFIDLLEGEKFGVPKIDRFMWQEGVLKLERTLNSTERVALERYDEVASIVVNK